MIEILFLHLLMHLEAIIKFQNLGGHLEVLDSKIMIFFNDSKYLNLKSGDFFF